MVILDCNSTQLGTALQNTSFVPLYNRLCIHFLNLLCNYTRFHILCRTLSLITHNSRLDIGLRLLFENMRVLLGIEYRQRLLLKNSNQKDKESLFLTKDCCSSGLADIFHSEFALLKELFRLNNLWGFD